MKSVQSNTQCSGMPSHVRCMNSLNIDTISQLEFIIDCFFLLWFCWINIKHQKHDNQVLCWINAQLYNIIFLLCRHILTRFFYVGYSRAFKWWLHTIKWIFLSLSGETPLYPILKIYYVANIWKFRFYISSTWNIALKYIQKILSLKRPRRN